MRQIVLDTETTGLEPKQGHRIIEIGCVEVIDRRITDNRYHQYINPEREIDEGAIEVHGISRAFLADKPRFVDIAEDFLSFISGAELIIHNAPFDVGFIDHELNLLNRQQDNISNICTVLDTLVLARKMHPGQKNNLDALCKRYNINNSLRDLHGALLDAEILADTYLAMTGGQTALSLGGHEESVNLNNDIINPRSISVDANQLKVVKANTAELALHQARLNAIRESSGGLCIWLNESE